MKKRLYSVIRAIITPVSHIMFNIKCVGRENVPKEGAFLLCANHTSMLDVVLLIALCPRRICFMAKKELFENFFTRWLFSSLGAFPVDRGGRDIEAIRHSCEVIKRGDPLGIFPEGRRYLEGGLREVKTGCAYIAYRTGADLIPVSIYKEKGVHPFRRVTVRFGEAEKNQTLCEGKPTKENLSISCKKIFDRINGLWELGF